MMREPLALPVVQRDALVERMADAICPPLYDREPSLPPLYADEAHAALAAIEETYVLIPRDQVSVEYADNFNEAGRYREYRLTTPWKENT